MEPEALMSLLSDRPPCCAGVREAATSRILELGRKVEELERAVGENHKIIHRQSHEITMMKELVRAFRGINSDLDRKIVGLSSTAYEGDIESRCRNWRGLHLAHGGLLFEAAAEEIKRLKEKLGEK